MSAAQWFARICQLAVRPGWLRNLSFPRLLRGPSEIVRHGRHAYCCFVYSLEATIMTEKKSELARGTSLYAVSECGRPLVAQRAAAAEEDWLRLVCGRDELVPAGVHPSSLTNCSRGPHVRMLEMRLQTPRRPIIP